MVFTKHYFVCPTLQYIYVEFKGKVPPPEWEYRIIAQDHNTKKYCLSTKPWENAGTARSDGATEKEYHADVYTGSAGRYDLNLVLLSPNGVANVAEYIFDRQGNSVIPGDGDWGKGMIDLPEQVPREITAEVDRSCPATATPVPATPTPTSSISGRPSPAAKVARIP